MNKLILLIEDNTEIRENLNELLALHGYKVLTADCGNEAISIAREFLPDLVICDILMPGMDGYEVLSALRNERETRHIPIIFSTAKSENADRKKAYELGADHYLIKPFDELELISSVTKTLNHRKIKKQQKRSNLRRSTIC